MNRPVASSANTSHKCALQMKAKLLAATTTALMALRPGADGRTAPVRDPHSLTIRFTTEDPELPRVFAPLALVQPRHRVALQGRRERESEPPRPAAQNAASVA